MKRKIAAVVMLVLLTAGILGLQYYRDTYLLTQHGMYRRDAKVLDFSGRKDPDLESISKFTNLEKLDLRNTGVTVAEYKILQEALPMCEILWQIPIQGQYVELDTEVLQVDTLTQEELEGLQYLPRLRKVSVGCGTDPDIVMQLKTLCPNLHVEYLIRIGTEEISGDAETVSGCCATVPELMEKLKYLPNLKELSLAIAEPDNEEMYGLIQAYPDIQIRWNVKVGDRRFVNMVRELDLSGMQMSDISEVENVLKFFPNVERVIMCGCGIPSEEMDALWKRNPEIRFVWSVQIAGKTVRTDVTTFMPYQYGIAALRNKDAQEMKYLVDVMCMDLGHMGIKDLSFLWHMPNLEYLIIADCGITDITPVQALTKLKYLEMFKNNIRDISALASCVSLRDLNMCYNSVRDFTPLYGLEKIEHLWLASNFVTNDTMYTLNDTFPEATIMYRTFSSTGNGWREIPGYYEQRDLLGMWYMTG